MKLRELAKMTAVDAKQAYLKHGAKGARDARNAEILRKKYGLQLKEAN